MKKFKWKLVMLDKNNSTKDKKVFRTVETFVGNQKQVQEHCIKHYNGNFWRDKSIKDEFTMRVDTYSRED